MIVPVVLAGLLSLGLLFAPASVAPWTMAVGWIPLIALNILLGFTAGVCASLGIILLKCAQYDEMEYEIDQLMRLRRVLRKFLPKKSIKLLVFGVALAMSGAARAEADACGIFVDRTAVDAVDRQRAVEFVLGSVFDYAYGADCRWVVAGTFAAENRFEEKTWIEVPPKRVGRNCSDAEPEPLRGHESVLQYIESVARYRKERAVKACAEEEGRKTEDDDSKREEFKRQLQKAVEFSSRGSRTHLTQFLRGLVRTGWYRAVVVVTDGIDDPPVHDHRLAVPAGASVTLLIVRPSPEYATPQRSLDHARQWASVPGVRVVTSGELRPGLWGDLGGGAR